MGVGSQLRTVIRLVLFFAVRILPKTLYHPWATVVHDASFPFSKRARSIKATAGSQPGRDYGKHAYHSTKVLELLAEATNTSPRHSIFIMMHIGGYCLIWRKRTRDQAPNIKYQRSQSDGNRGEMPVWGVRMGSRDSKGKMEVLARLSKMTQSGGLSNPDLWPGPRSLCSNCPPELKCGRRRPDPPLGSDT